MVGLGVGSFFLLVTCWDGLFEMGKDPINLGIDIACSGFKHCDAVIHLGIEVTLFIDLVADEFKMRINGNVRLSKRMDVSCGLCGWGSYRSWKEGG